MSNLLGDVQLAGQDKQRSCSINHYEVKNSVR